MCVKEWLRKKKKNLCRLLLNGEKCLPPNRVPVLYLNNCSDLDDSYTVFQKVVGKVQQKKVVAEYFYVSYYQIQNQKTSLVEDICLELHTELHISEALGMEATGTAVTVVDIRK